jgi:hypothetical protein
LYTLVYLDIFSSEILGIRKNLKKYIFKAQLHSIGIPLAVAKLNYIALAFQTLWFEKKSEVSGIS